MSKQLKKSRCAFVVIKFKIQRKNYFVMRRNLVWKDVNFIGGHERSEDGGKLEKTARRELLEEVSTLRKFRSFELTPLSDEIAYGPIPSQSAGCQVNYLLQFFYLKFKEIPKMLFEMQWAKTRNVVLSQEDMLTGHKYRITGLVNVLNSTLPNGICSIPYCWPEDMGATLSDGGVFLRDQLELSFE